MNRILPIGSVVRLKNGTQKIMIINRGALFNHEGTVGYFDYSACIYPFGQTDQTVCFFNEEDIGEIYFEGYRDETEEAYCKEYQEKIRQTAYPHFHTKTDTVQHVFRENAHETRKKITDQ